MLIVELSSSAILYHLKTAVVRKERLGKGEQLVEGSADYYSGNCCVKEANYFLFFEILSELLHGAKVHPKVSGLNSDKLQKS